MAKSKKVLLVEDDALIVELYQERFSEEDDIELKVARDGKLALKEVDGQYDLILLDILLPEINGFTVLKKLKEKAETRDIPVVVLTNLGSERTDTDKQVALSLGAVDYLVKSFHTPDELVEIVRKRLWPTKN